MINSIARQKLQGFRVVEIIVACDGCNDGTVKLLKALSKTNSKLRVIKGKTRKGKCYRLNQLYQLSKGDIVVQVDADGMLAKPTTLQKLVERISSSDIVLVAGNNQPAPATNFFQSIMNTIFDLWYEIRKDYKSGDNIFNYHGMMAAMPTAFAKSVHYPTSLFADQHFLYIRAKNVGKFVFARRAIILFTSPTNFDDFLTQAKRSLRDRVSVAEHLGNEILSYFDIDTNYKLAGIFHYFLKKPLLTSLGLCYMVVLRTLPEKKNAFLVNPGIWKISTSTKQSINLR